VGYTLFRNDRLSTNIKLIIDDTLVIYTMTYSCTALEFRQKLIFRNCSTCKTKLLTRFTTFQDACPSVIHARFNHKNMQATRRYSTKLRYIFFFYNSGQGKIQSRKCKWSLLSSSSALQLSRVDSANSSSLCDKGTALKKTLNEIFSTGG